MPRYLAGVKETELNIEKLMQNLNTKFTLVNIGLTRFDIDTQMLV